MAQNLGHLYEFGPFLLDTAQHLLTRQGETVPLTPKTYNLLVLLIENRGRLLAKGELMKTLWPDSFVEESNLPQQVSVIRRALGETPGQDRYIVTVPGQGYRFAAPVTERSSLPEPDVAAERAQDEFSPAQAGNSGAFRWRTRRLVLVCGIAVLAAGTFAIGRYELRKEVSARSTPQQPHSLAVLPFRSARQDPKSDFLGVSLADAVITRLGDISSINVRPSSAITKYRDQQVDAKAVAAELQVDNILTGSFTRDGDDVRITSQLTDGKAGTVLWKGDFDLKYAALLDFQDRVAAQIIKGLELTLSPEEAERLKPGLRIDPLAYEYYLRGVDLYSRSEFTLAIKMLERSIEMESKYPPTWAHLGRSHTANASFELGGREEYLKAQAAYERALFLQPTQIEAQIYMANLFTDMGKVERSVPLLRNVLAANINHAEAHWELGYAYRFAGMLEESISECERARHLDPGVKLTSSALNSYLYLGRYDRFLESLPKHTDSALVLFYRGLGEYYNNNPRHAAEYFDRAFEIRPTLLHAKVGKALSYGVKNDNSKGIAILGETASKITDLGVGDAEAAYKVAQAYAVLGDKPSAMRVLQFSIENGFFCYPYLMTDPLTENLRGENGFLPLMAAARQRREAFKAKFFSISSSKPI